MALLLRIWVLLIAEFLLFLQTLPPLFRGTGSIAQQPPEHYIANSNVFICSLWERATTQNQLHRAWAGAVARSQHASLVEDQLAEPSTIRWSRLMGEAAQKRSSLDACVLAVQVPLLTIPKKKTGHGPCVDFLSDSGPDMCTSVCMPGPTFRLDHHQRAGH